MEGSACLNAGMGFKKWFTAQNERYDQVKFNKADAPYRALYGVHTVANGNYVYMESFKRIVKPIGGAAAEFDPGYSDESTTLTRVAAGAVIAGPVGAIVGGMFKKQKGRCYVTVTFPDGEVAVIDGPVKDTSKLRHFTQQVNKASAHYAQ